MADRPWMPFFGEDFFRSTTVRAMCAEAKVMYLELLWLQWKDGSLSADLDRLAAILGMTRTRFRKLWEQVRVKFRPLVEDPDRLENEEMAGHLAHADELAKRRRARVQAALDARKGGHAEHVTDNVTLNVTSDVTSNVTSATVHSSHLPSGEGGAFAPAAVAAPPPIPPPEPRHKPQKQPPKAHPARHFVIDAWDRWFREQTGEPPTWDAKNRGIADQLARKHEIPEIRDRLERLRGLTWLWRDRGSGLEVTPCIGDFASNFDRLAKPANGVPAPGSAGPVEHDPFNVERIAKRLGIDPCS